MKERLSRKKLGLWGNERLNKRLRGTAAGRGNCLSGDRVGRALTPSSSATDLSFCSTIICFARVQYDAGTFLNNFAYLFEFTRATTASLNL